MIKISDIHRCCGCGGCVQVCPHNCIRMVEDEEGFLYPEVDVDKCIDCGLCEKVCPCQNDLDIQPSLKKTYALKDNDDSRVKSSSGGAFASIASYVLSQGGIVYGATLGPRKEVLHVAIESEAELDRLRGSKYAQSNLGGTYSDIKKHLIAGRLVLFSGVSCQVKGLKTFLRKDYENLLTVEILCHGVSSPGIYHKYLNEICAKYKKEREEMENIFFRNPKIWKEFILSIQLKDGWVLKGPLDNAFMKGFSTNLIVRPSCFDCQAKCLKAGSDVLLGDFWCLEYLDEEFTDNKGVSLVIMNTPKGVDLISHLDSEVKEFKYEQALLGNRNIEHSQKEPQNRRAFFESYKFSNDYTSTIISFTKLPLKLRIRHWLSLPLKAIGFQGMIERRNDKKQRKLFFEGKLD